MNVVKLLAIFFTIELLLLLGVMVITGIWSTQGPMKFFTDIAASNGTDIWSMATAFFVVGTFLNMVFMFIMAAFGER